MLLLQINLFPPKNQNVESADVVFVKKPNIMSCKFEEKLI